LKSRKDAAPTIDRSIHVTNCHIQALDAEKMEAIVAQAEAARANADAIKESRSRIERLMRRHGIRAIMARPRRVRTTDSCHDFPIAPNLL
jgi:hypothetical protein